MQYRSTNTTGYVHYGGALIAGVEHGGGIELNPVTSTSGVPRIQPAGDEQNKSIAILGKGTGGVLLGSTTASALAFKGAFTSTITYQLAAVSSGQVGLVTLASTDCDVQPGDLISISVVPTTNALVFGGYRQSTADTSRITITMANVTSSVTSTTSGEVRVTWIDFT